MDGERGTAIREAELKVIEAATNHVCHVAPWFRLDRCAICRAVNALEKAKSGVADVESAAPDLKAENTKLQAELTVRRITCERLEAGMADANLQNRELQNAVDRANAAMLKHQKHNGALEIAIQEAHRDADALAAQVKTWQNRSNDAERLNGDYKTLLEKLLEFGENAGTWRGEKDWSSWDMTHAEDKKLDGLWDEVRAILSTPLKRKCPSTYTHTSLGKLECEKDEPHLHRVGDVEHRRGQTVWFSI